MAFTSQVLHDSARNYVIKIHSTGGDAAALLVDVSGMNPPATRVVLEKVWYDIEVGGQAALLWDADTDVTILNLTAGNGQTMCFKDIGGLPNNAGTGVTGDVLLTTTAALDSTLILWFKKAGTVTVVSP